MEPVRFDAALYRKYDTAGPRYTSYPTAPQFHEGFDESAYREQARLGNEDPIPKPLSLYVHIPFCESLCYYCACNKIITRHRNKSVRYLQYLNREIALQGRLFDDDRQVEQLHFGGGTPTYLSDEQLQALMVELGQRFNLAEPARREFSIEVDPRALGPETLPVLAAEGMNRISMGVQDFDPAVQRAVNRLQSFELTEAAVRQARESGFRSVSLDLIYGLPLQNLASFERTLDQVLSLRPERLAIYNYAHLPHLVKAQKLIRQADLPSPPVKLQLLALSIERLTAAGYVYIGMDHFARPDDELALARERGDLQRNFQGYSTHADTDLVGLGNTAIGKLAHSYSQNLKTLNSYYAELDAGRLPVWRGVRLDDDDRLRRDVINRLMCQERLDYSEVEERHHIVFRNYFAAELRALESMAVDGLLEIERRGLRVTPVGRLLLRNIAMVFDSYLNHDQGQTRFSRTV
ncbi:oxygen-independent coproporphyrinogen III oxidase [Alkalilimnicola sp. S0819]|uniref:oxygen-independent coproporphyrinogen III oxidase n=1 Tax=Alkalilimnicola sp. S0819 TaxID=2613922 RepID=UPI001261BDC9|nr:oxygen-independent coproporphyrinogen III oxidase [Alkalilimnicola sp. S0819]KAB7624399.1 oxygen-independent coproporphyrinogen III oxidase [Alkalilimnicola sp. S0819]MPQ16226.1 oxygen-independent coproporphyrinogen III oxidase [Alkalilimnicola sp. S0819]